MFKVGDLVAHRQFGRGEVVGVADDAYIIKFEELETVRNVRKDFLGLELCGTEEAAREIMKAAALVRVMKGYLENLTNPDSIGDSKIQMLSLITQCDVILSRIKKGVELLP